MKKTPWFSGNLKPVRNGLYQRQSEWSCSIIWSYFKNGIWYWNSDNPAEALRRFNADTKSSFSSLKWRGISK